MGEQLALLVDDAAWPGSPGAPALTVRVSARARRMTLQMIPPRTLEVVVPKGVGAQAVQAFVSEHSEWIRAAEAELARLQLHTIDLLPERIELCAVGRSWPVDYVAAPRRVGRVREIGGALAVFAETDSERARLLRNWLLEQGRRHLKPWLAIEAARVGARYRRAQVRLQRTRWGSCSSARNISLNAALLLVEPELVRYLLVHELCHLRHLNHSGRYWRLVERFEPDYRRLDARLADAWSRVPYWALVKAR